MHQIDQVCNQHVRRKDCLLVIGPKNSGKSMLFYAFKGQGLEQIDNEEGMQVLELENQENKKLVSESYDLPIKFNVFTSNNQSIIDMPTFRDLNDQQKDNEALYLEMYFWQIVLLSAKSLKFVVVIPYQSCTSPDDLTKFQKSFQTLINHKAESYQQFCQSISLVFSKLEYEEDKDEFIPILQGIKEQKDYQEVEMTSFENVLEQQRTHLFFNQMLQEGEGIELLEQINSKGKTVEGKQLFNLKLGFELIVNKNSNEEYKEKMEQKIKEQWKHFRQQLQSLFQVIFLDSILYMGENSEVEENLKNTLESINYKQQIERDQDVQTGLQFLHEVHKTIQGQPFPKAIQLIDHLLRFSQIQDIILAYEFLKQIRYSIQFFQIFNQPVEGKQLTATLKQAFQKKLNAHISQYEKDLQSSELFKDLIENYGGEVEEVVEGEQEEIVYECRNFMKEESPTIDAVFQQMKIKYDKVKKKICKNAKDVEKSMESVQTQINPDKKETLLKKLAELFRKYNQIQATILTYMELNEYKLLLDYFSENYFKLLVAQNNDSYSFNIFQILIKYIIRLKLQNKEDEEVDEFCRKILDKAFNYLISEEVSNEEDYEMVKLSHESYQSKFAEGTFSDEKSIMSTYSVFTKEKKKNLISLDKSIASTEITTSMKKTKNKSATLPMSQLRLLKYLKELKYQDQRKLYDRIELKERLQMLNLDYFKKELRRYEQLQ